MVQPLIITGQMRSGTTLLANYLNSNKGIVVYADFLRSILGVNLDYIPDGFNSELDLYKKNVLVSSLIAEGRLNGLPLDNLIDRDKIKTWHDTYSTSIAAINSYENNKNQIVGVKRTGYVAFLDDLLNSGTRIIYVYRDPRDVLYSSKNRFVGYSEYSFIDEYNVSVSKHFAIEHPNFFKVKFEDLILKKELTIAKMSTFLNFTLQPNLDKLNDKKGLEFISNSSFSDVSKLFDANAVKRYSKIPLEETLRIEVLCSNLIERLGYEPRKIPLMKVKQIRRKYKSYKRKDLLRKSLRTIFSKIVN